MVNKSILYRYLTGVLVIIFFVFFNQQAQAEKVINHKYKNIFALVNMGCMDNPAEKKILIDKAMMFNDFLIRVLKVPKSNIMIEGNIKNGLDWLKNNSDIESLVIIYMIGHGMQNKSGTYYCYMDPNISFDYIGHKEFHEKTSSIKARDIVSVLDFCNSGGFVESSNKKWYFTSCKSDEYTVYNKSFDKKVTVRPTHLGSYSRIGL